MAKTHMCAFWNKLHHILIEDGENISRCKSFRCHPRHFFKKQCQISAVDAIGYACGKRGHRKFQHSLQQQQHEKHCKSLGFFSDGRDVHWALGWDPSMTLVNQLQFSTLRALGEFPRDLSHPYLQTRLLL